MALKSHKKAYVPGDMSVAFENVAEALNDTVKALDIASFDTAMKGLKVLKRRRLLSNELADDIFDSVVGMETSASALVAEHPEMAKKLADLRRLVFPFRTPQAMR